MIPRFVMFSRLMFKCPSAKSNLSGLKYVYRTIHSKSLVQPVLVVHGGAEYVPDARKQGKLDGVKKAADKGYKVLMETGNVLDAVETAICEMENNESFNAGRGSALNIAGQVEMDALISEGKTFSTGSVTLVKNITNPISLARMVMEKTPHVILGGEGIEDFIVKMAVPRVSEDYLITEGAKRDLEKFKKKLESKNPGSGGTVGCVAVDIMGHVASGTSTGGMTGKHRGRIGDSPLPGSGGYCDDEIGAVSATGHGELILKYNLSHRILSLMKNGESPQNAVATAFEHMLIRLENKVQAGAIIVSNKGEVGIFFSTKNMPWAYRTGNERHHGIDKGQDIVEKVV